MQWGEGGKKEGFVGRHAHWRADFGRKVGRCAH